MWPNIIGREAEIKKLEKLINSQKSEFLALYGRRRVGKTYLIRQFVSQQQGTLFFEFIGQNGASLHEQLENFSKNFSKLFYEGINLQPPKSWKEALELLTKEIEKNKKKKFVIFFDELPWMCSARSGLLDAIDYTWNSSWSKLPNILFIVCGSAASWMLNNVINAKGGLYNRLTTAPMNIAPFNIKETLSYLRVKKIRYSVKTCLELYFITGGVPYYLNEIKRELSLSENINQMAFTKDGILYHDYKKIFSSLFDDSESHYRIMLALSKTRQGLSRNELLKKTKMSSGGRFNKRLEELSASQFISLYIPYGHKKKDIHIKISDEYCWFYLNWIENYTPPRSLQNIDYWNSVANGQKWKAWAGFAFEEFCQKHITLLADALNLTNKIKRVHSWQYQAKNKNDKGAQIDLLIERNDQCIHIFEAKFYNDLYSVTKSYAQELKNKMEVFSNKTKYKGDILLTIITIEGFKPNTWSEDLIDSHVSVKDILS